MLSDEQGAAIRRLTAANWIASVTGRQVKSSTDFELRTALWDGIQLCEALNYYSGGAVIQIHEPEVHGALVETNLRSFISAWTAVRLPPDVCFSLDDFKSGPQSERPQVVECILTLKHRVDLEIERKREYPPAMDVDNAELENGKPFARVRVSGSSVKYASKHQVHNTVGVTKLMQQCTSMLREKMWNENHSRPAPPSLRFRDTNTPAQPESALEAMGPVLESVLGSLTQEYEKRLLLKDQEIKSTADQLSALQAQVARLEALNSEGQAGNLPQLEYRMSNEDREEYERLQVLEQELGARMQGHSNEIDAINSEYRSLKNENMRLEIVCKEFQEKVLAGEQFLNNYKSIQDENRKLYNLVQDLRGNIRVFCRVRPSGATGDQSPSCVSIGEEGQIAIYKPQTKGRNVFAYDKIFGPTSTQEQVYIETQPLIRSVLDGYNVCIFAYGQTGSGKTHTMSGTSLDRPSNRGINFRALDDLFDIQHQRRGETKYTIRVQMLEVYNEIVRDLLCGEQGKGAHLEVLNTKGSGTNVPNAIYIDVNSTQDVMDVMDTGDRNRLTAMTKMNERSSRSHSVLTVIVDGYNSVTERYSHGCLHLIDLAGSERVNKSEVVGARLEEAKFINKSLSAIGDVMSALANKSTHIPFRNSKLTQLLADSLSGKAKVMMFVHISPEASSHGESLSSMKFGARVSEITLGQAKKNVELGATLVAKETQVKLATQLNDKNAVIDSLQADLQARSSELKRTKAEAESARRRNEHLEAMLQEMQVANSSKSVRTRESVPANPLHSDQSASSMANSTHTPRLSSGSHSTPAVAPKMRRSLTGGLPTPTSAEEKHISRMRAHLERRGIASPTPSRPRTSTGAAGSSDLPPTPNSASGSSAKTTGRSSRPMSASFAQPSPHRRSSTTPRS